VGFCVCCEIPKAKNPADLSSTMLKQSNLSFEAKPIAKGAFLEPGEITILKNSNFSQ
jgi:hypothetical protein